MKGVIIGTDLLQDENGELKVLEINTSVGLYQDGNQYLDLTEFFNLLTGNSINELHFIYNESDVNIQNTKNFQTQNLGNGTNQFTQFTFRHMLETRCISNSITYQEYEVPNNAITVPYIEDADNKFILRLSYDSTAVIDSEYCGDKYNFQNLISGSTFSIGSYCNSTDLDINTFNEVVTGGTPNAIVKYRYPDYDKKQYPEIYVLSDETQLTNLKNSIPTDFYLQEYVYSDLNIVNNRNSVIRSVDIVYGAELDVCHLGSYTASSLVKNDVWQDEVDGLTGKITNKSRVKYINGFTTSDNQMIYHVDDDTKVVSSTDTLLNMSQIEVGTGLKTVNFSNLAKTDRPEFFTSSLTETENNLTFGTTTVQELKSQTYDGLFLNIQLEDGTSWSDVPGSNLYVEHSGSNVTSFKRVNMLNVGDKILTLANNDNTLSTIEITDITVTYENKTIYEVDVEESDLFLTSIGDENSVLKLMIQHNPCYSCGYSWAPCGSWACQSYCPSCDMCFIGGTKITTETGYKNIEDIEVGDIVMSYLEGSEILIPRTVIGLLNIEYNGGLVIINGIKTNATIGHPFAVKNNEGELKWAAFDKTIDQHYLNEGIVVNNLSDEEYSIYLNGSWVKIETVNLESFEGTVYNIGVEDTHNYFANDILVHNVDKKIAPFH
jgi:hypothetical protein